MDHDTDTGQARKERFLRELDADVPDRPVGLAEVAAYIALGLIVASAVLEAQQGTLEPRVVSSHAR